jgi:hypothetical protein
MSAVVYLAVGLIGIIFAMISFTGLEHGNDK